MNSKYFTLIVFSLILSSCANIRYAQSYNTPKGLDFIEKQYLLNEVYSPYAASTYDSFNNGLKAIGGNAVDFIIDARNKGVIVPQNMKFEVSHEDLDILALSKEYDYLIQVSTSKDYETDDMQLAGLNISSSRARITIRAHDVYNKQIAYEQTIVVLSEKDNNQEKSLSYSAAPIYLIKKALNKALVDINKYKRK